MEASSLPPSSNSLEKEVKEGERGVWGSDSSCIRSRCFLELIEVPSYMLQEEPGTRRRAMDLAKRPELLGWNHLALDVTQSIRNMQPETTSTTQQQRNGTLSMFLEQLNATSFQQFGKTLRVALEPKQQLIGNEVYELAFLYDADGCLIELLHKQTELKQTIDSGWMPRDDLDFLGKSSPNEPE